MADRIITVTGEPTTFGRSAHLEFKPAHEIPAEDPATSWLIQDIWAAQGVGIIGGPPKAMKSWLTTDAAISVASGTAFLGRFETKESGPVMMISMEGTPGLLRHRLDGVAQARGLTLDSLPIQILMTAVLHLDDGHGFLALENAVRAEKPKLLVLDPFVRVFRGNEDDAGSVAPVLGLLRKLQREYGTAIMVVHHSRKSATTTTGQSLRGSGDLHAWGDSNLYLSKEDGGSRVTIEHRATESEQGFRFTVRDRSLVIVDAPAEAACGAPVGTLADRVIALLGSGALGLTDIQTQVKVRRESVAEVVRELEGRGLIEEVRRKWRLKEANEVPDQDG